MKPISRKVMKSNNLLQSLGFGVKQTIANIKGSTVKLGQKYQDATIVLYNKANLQPIAIRKPDEDGKYQFLGLNKDVVCFIVGLDKHNQYNAVIQDNVVLK